VTKRFPYGAYRDRSLKDLEPCKQHRGETGPIGIRGKCLWAFKQATALPAASAPRLIS